MQETSQDKIQNQEINLEKIEKFNQIKDKNEKTYKWISYDKNNKAHLDTIILRDYLKNYIIYTENGFYAYNEGKYAHVTLESILLLIEGLIPSTCNQLKSTKNVNEVANLLKRSNYSVNDFNKFKYLSNFSNTLIYFNDDGTYRLIEHNKHNLITYQCTTRFMKDVECKVWNKFLNEVLEEDQIYLLQEIMGFFMIPCNSIKKFYLLYGPPDCGKSVILNVIKTIIGINNISSVTLQQIGSDHRFITSQLFGKLINICGDLPSKGIKDTGILKMLTGDDLINAERKGKDHFEFTNLARLIFSCNKLPSSYNDKTDAFYNRLLIIPFTRSIPEHKQDVNLLTKFNYNGITSWCVEGLIRLLKNGLKLSVSELNKKYLENYKIENSNVYMFLSDKCEIIDDKYTRTSELYAKYKEYCFECGYGLLGKNNFLKELYTFDKRLIIDKHLKFGNETTSGIRNLIIN